MTMIEVIREWIRLTNQQYLPQRKPCTEFNDLFAGYFPEEFLATSYYVIVPQMPVPAHEFLAQHGLTDLFNRDLAGLTLNDTYYLIQTHENDLQIHFHELVRVAQWHHWGVEGFISRYLEELKNFGYDNMPLERMAHDLGGYYVAGDALVNVPRIIEALK
jgi:hypothetical protein